MTTIKNLKNGDYFTLKQIDEPTENQVWVKDEWDASERKYLAHKFSDVNTCRYFKGDKQVYIDFCF